MKKSKAKYKRYKKENVYPFVSKCYRLLEEHPDLFSLKKLYNCRGKCYEDSIQLDYRHELISTLVHEVLHFLHDDWSETKVLIQEAKIMNALSLCQVKHILHKFAAAF